MTIARTLGDISASSLQVRTDFLLITVSLPQHALFAKNCIIYGRYL
jgi:hypothetical protein